MKNLDLNAYGVVAMPKQEMQKTDGGTPWGWIVFAADVLCEAFVGQSMSGLAADGIKAAAKGYVKSCTLHGPVRSVR